MPTVTVPASALSITCESPATAEAIASETLVFSSPAAELTALPALDTALPARDVAEAMALPAALVRSRRARADDAAGVLPPPQLASTSVAAAAAPMVVAILRNLMGFVPFVDSCVRGAVPRLTGGSVREDLGQEVLGAVARRGW